MLYARINGEKRPPRVKGERTLCNCGAELRSVMPAENVPHWRHKTGDCDSWSEPEGPWHLAWKEAFDPEYREIPLVDAETEERHRADILYDGRTGGISTVLELQHSSISEEERMARERFYCQKHRMFWLLHIHGEKSFLDFNFGISLNMKKCPVSYNGRVFSVMDWMGRNKQFIEKWKRSRAHVFFDYSGIIFFLAGEKLSRSLGGPFPRGGYALYHLERDKFIKAVKGLD